MCSIKQAHSPKQRLSSATVLTTDGWSEDEVLRLAACLEEHFPHPVARAVVRGAEERDLKHRERHAEVEYIVGPRPCFFA